MTLDDLRHILDLVREHELAEFELEHDGMKLRLRKQAEAAPAALVAAPLITPPVLAGAVAPPPAAASPAAAPPPSPAEEGVELAIVTAPLVGTFYGAPSPDAPPFVEVGARVRRGQSLCIIEAMKLMNEIESEYDGELVKVYVDNGQPVQYGERLFAIRRD
jgi:acetyl-CoA carboxylase biotin carboxyl carrier protein